MIEVPVAELAAWKGKVLGPGEWRTVTQEQVNLFADATGDHQWIHVDEEKAKAGPFGGTIVHGYMTLSLLPSMQQELWQLTGALMGINYGSDKVRFLTPVPVGSRVRLSVTIGDVQTRPDGSLLLSNEATVEIENAPKPALVAQTLAMVVPAP